MLSGSLFIFTVLFPEFFLQFRICLFLSRLAQLSGHYIIIPGFQFLFARLRTAAGRLSRTGPFN